MRTQTRPRTGRILRWAALMVLLIALPASASHRFDDVPTSRTGHGEISRIAEAGITVGCAGGDDYCPDVEVPRWQMAIFLDRVASRSASATSVSTFRGASGGGLGATPVTVDLLSGAERRATGSVTLDGSVTVTGDGATCPCEVEAFLYRVSDDRKIGASMFAQMPATEAGTQQSSVTVALSGGIGQVGDRTETYAIGVFINNGNPAGVKATGSITAHWTPYDGG